MNNEARNLFTFACAVVTLALAWMAVAVPVYRDEVFHAAYPTAYPVRP